MREFAILLCVLALTGAQTLDAFPSLDPEGLERLVDARENLQHLATASEVLRDVDLSAPTILKQIHERKNTTASFNDTVLEYMNCTLGLIDLVNGAKKFEIWALKMIDASTKLPSGLLQGNLVDLGQYDECVDIERETEPVRYIGQHCLVQLVLSLPGLANSYININGGKVKIVDLLGGTSIKLTISQCLPNTCEPYMVEAAFQEIFTPINGLLASKNMTLSAIVNPRDCHTKDRGTWRVEEWVVLVICILFVVLAIVCSLLDKFLIKGKKPTNPERIIQAFSVQNNFSKLFGTKTAADQMSAINGMKFFSIAWVVLGHRYRYSIQQPLVNLLRIPDMMTDWTKMFLLNATLSVDTFFLISGLLNAYGFFTIMEKKRRYTILDLIIGYIHRYIRLSPSYMIMIAITGSWLWRVNDGPYWDVLVGDARNNCQKNWWANIIYLNNYLTPDHNCMMQSWYLAADMQMFWLSPFVLYPMWRWPIFGLVELLILCLASIASPFAISYIYDIREPIPLSNNEAKVSKEMDLLYFPTHTKTVAYVVGIFVGYLLQKARTKKIRLPLNMINCCIGWIVSGVFLLYALFGCYWLFQPNNPYTKFESSLYLGFYRFFWSVGVGWVLVVCIMGWGGFVNKWLSWRQFGPLGRLTYCIYLTHIAIVLNKMGSIRTAMYLSDWDQVEQFLGDLFFSMISATILSLLLESPILTIEKIVFGRGSPREPRRPENGNNNVTNSRSSEENPPRRSLEREILTKDPDNPGPRIRFVDPEIPMPTARNVKHGDVEAVRL